MERARTHTTSPSSNARLISIAEFAERIRRSRRSIEKDVEAGRVPPPIRVGRSVRWRLSDIEQWIAMGCPPREPSSGEGSAA